MNEKRRARGDGRIFMRGNIACIQYYDARGKQIRESSESPNEKKAAKLLRTRLGEVAAGVHRDVRSVTYNSLRESYYADYETNARKSLRRDRDGKPYLDKVARLDSFFTGYRASVIDTDLIRKFIGDQQKKGLANGTVNRSISALRRMFNLAMADGTLRDVPRFPMLKEAAPRQGFLERDQYETLSRCLPDYLRLPLAIGYFTSMRLGEVLELKWDQVDFLAGEIRLLAGTTKNDEGRVVLIIPQLRTKLKEQFAKRQPACAHVCFKLDSKGHAVKIDSCRKAWCSACVKAGLGKMVPAVDTAGSAGYEPLRGPRSKRKVKMVYEGTIFHDLRRCGVRNLVRAGVPERVAMKISGHKTRSTFERYNITSAADISDAGKKLANFHSEKFGDNSGTITELRSATVVISN
jgi:integrase